MITTATLTRARPIDSAPHVATSTETKYDFLLSALDLSAALDAGRAASTEYCATLARVLVTGCREFIKADPSFIETVMKTAVAAHTKGFDYGVVPPHLFPGLHGTTKTMADQAFRWMKEKVSFGQAFVLHLTTLKDLIEARNEELDAKSSQLLQLAETVTMHFHHRYKKEAKEGDSRMKPFDRGAESIALLSEELRDVEPELAALVRILYTEAVLRPLLASEDIEPKKGAQILMRRLNEKKVSFDPKHLELFYQEFSDQTIDPARHAATDEELLRRLYALAPDANEALEDRICVLLERCSSLAERSRIVKSASAIWALATETALTTAYKVQNDEVTALPLVTRYLTAGQLSELQAAFTTYNKAAVSAYPVLIGQAPRTPLCVVEAFLATDTDTLHINGALPWRSEISNVTAEVKQLLCESYRMVKSGVYPGGANVVAAVASAKALVGWELQALGVALSSVSIEESEKIVTVQFDWSHSGKKSDERKRTIFYRPYTEEDCLVDGSHVRLQFNGDVLALVEYKKMQIGDGIDAYIFTAPAVAAADLTLPPLLVVSQEDTPLEVPTDERAVQAKVSKPSAAPSLKPSKPVTPQLRVTGEIQALAKTLREEGKLLNFAAEELATFNPELQALERGRGLSSKESKKIVRGVRQLASKARSNLLQKNFLEKLQANLDSNEDKLRGQAVDLTVG